MSFYVIIPAILAFLFAFSIAGDCPETTPTEDRVTQGSWQTMYGSCAYILSAYNAPDGCEFPLLYGENQGDITGCQGNYKGGASLDLTDCRELDLNGDGTDDVVYDVYAGPYAVSPVRILTNNDGTCSDINGIWFGSNSWNGSWNYGVCGWTGHQSGDMSYTISGVPAGNYRVAVYVMSWDNHDRRQRIRGQIGSNYSDWDLYIGDYYNGVYAIFEANIASGESLTFWHDNTAGANAVVSGIFFDEIGYAPPCANGKICFTGINDTTTGGRWTTEYGDDGYILINRGGGSIGCADDSKNVKGNFGGASVTVAPGNHALRYTWSGYNECDGDHPLGKNAMGYIWNCVETDPRALLPPTGGCPNLDGQHINCAATWTSATWDDAGEKQQEGPNLYTDISINLPGCWVITVYAVDFDSYVRKQKYNLYYQHTTDLIYSYDIGSFSEGVYVSFPVQGPIDLTLETIKYQGANAIISGIFIDPQEGYTCEGVPVSPDCDLEAFCTYTQGGWGAPAHGSNPGTVRDGHWYDVYPTDVYPNGLVIQGSGEECHKLTFTGPGAVENFLPCGGPAKPLTKDYTDPDCNIPGNKKHGVLAAQLTALHLNRDFGCAGFLYDPDYGVYEGVCIGELIINQGSFTGLTVNEFIALADDAFSCGILPDLDADGTPDADFSHISEAATAINENFDDCEPGGFLDCPDEPPQLECDLNITKEVSASQDLNGDGQQPDAYPGTNLTYALTVSTGNCTLNNVTVTDVLPSFTIDDVTLDAYIWLDNVTFSPSGGYTYNYDDNTNTLTVNIGTMGPLSAVTVYYDVQVNLLAPIGECLTNISTVSGEDEQGTPYDDSASMAVCIIPDTNGDYATDDIGTPGYWCNHIDQSKQNAFDEAVVLNWLEIIEYASRWFDEHEYGKTGCTDWHDVSGCSLESALSILGQPKPGGGWSCGGADPSDQESKLEKHLLTLWFNVASGNIWTDITLDMLCVGEKPFPAGTDMTMTIGEVLVNGETALLTADFGSYLFWKDIIDAINNSESPYDYDGDGVNGLQNDPVTPFDPRFDGFPCQMRIPDMHEQIPLKTETDSTGGDVLKPNK
jgi:uncharacterized repeat protein (TIGR01451 family)